MFRLVVPVFVVLGLASSTASAWCDEPWAPVTTATSLPAGCPIDLWMDNAGPIYRWDGGVRGAALDGEMIAEDVRSMGVTYGCLAGQCSHHRTDFVFYPDRVRFTLADPPGTTVVLGDVSGPLVEYELTDGGGCPAGQVGPSKQCGDPAMCTIGCDDDDGGCAVGGARPRDRFPVAIIAAMAAAVAFVTRRRRRR